MIDSKSRAIQLMHRMFGVQNGASNGMIEQMIDFLIKAAVDEMKATDKDSLSVRATTEQSSAVGWPPPGTRCSRMNADGKWEEVQG